MGDHWRKEDDSRMGKRILDGIEREATYPFLLEQEKRLKEFWQKAGEAVDTGEQVFIGTYMGRDIWVTAKPPA